MLFHSKNTLSLHSKNIEENLPKWLVILAFKYSSAAGGLQLHTAMAYQPPSMPWYGAHMARKT